MLGWEGETEENKRDAAHTAHRMTRPPLPAPDSRRAQRFSFVIGIGVTDGNDRRWNR